MYEHLSCIALRTVKYDDRHNIVTAWTAQHGRVGLIVAAGGTREAARRRALMMPLGTFEGEVDIRPGRELYNIKDVRPLGVHTSIASSPGKAVVALFLAEVLDRILREASPDESMTEFIFKSIDILESAGARGTANFPLVFLSRLSAFLGIEPDASEWKRGRIFDMADGIYRMTAPTTGKWLTPAEAKVGATVQRLTFAGAERMNIPRWLRREILDRIIEYYTLHLVSLENIKSLSILRELS